MHAYVRAGAHLDLDRPGEVADVDKEGDVGAVAEVKVLVGEAVLELLDVAAGHDGDLLARLGSCWSGGGAGPGEEEAEKEEEEDEEAWSTFIAGFTSVDDWVSREVKTIDVFCLGQFNNLPDDDATTAEEGNNSLGGSQRLNTVQVVRCVLRRNTLLPQVPVKLVAQVMFRLKFLEALMNMSRSRFGCRKWGGAEKQRPLSQFQSQHPPSDLPHPAAGQTGSTATLMAG